jgi:hypothetical protein
MSQSLYIKFSFFLTIVNFICLHCDVSLKAVMIKIEKVETLFSEYCCLSEVDYVQYTDSST